ncbi:D-alanyl-D-alanine dipeptidase [Mycobacterium koreense]|uniref:D-alanyl-D-alanine dipeptidase n=1 Tax=Mycolicibacillus koreensis TaxID=1069220 RepID=A0A7I7SHV1_9MYCO|nr:M15 family metallopeptidase [Mycolicibacillus koreensis]MCV7247346.1 D-alanyl-D-alanine dipeptidase [Mycolicibacillus koreensis]OSC34421.1 D-alanyl-D-alanine dipeptidase [Mycolicibacillus koreensis]BBY56537.1 D-alanyl-D-alanine dipeptidase [Mycolicibacillus koreensis]
MVRVMVAVLLGVLAGGVSAWPARADVPADVPPVSPAAAADGLVDVRTVVADAVIDLRYATPDNFTGVQLYPADARCLVHESMAPGLATAAATLRAGGERLVFWDCYRPHAVQVRMFEVVPDPAWVARPGSAARSHEAGRSVDVTVAAVHSPCAPQRRLGADLCLLDMGTGFDDFTPRAHAGATDGLSAEVLRNRARLAAAMEAGGLSVYSGEWWHFDGPGAGVDRPFLSAPVN